LDEAFESAAMSASSTPDSPPDALAATKPGGAVFHNYRWVICALLFLATTINYVDRQILSLLKPMLAEQMKWTDAEYGWITSAFLGAYGIGLLAFGWFVDRFGTKVGYAVSIIVWSVGAFGHALVGSVWGFLMARVVLGLGEGGNFPSAIKAVALWFPKKERALATSLFNAGTNIGAVAAPAFLPFIARAWGWKSAFMLAGAAGFMWLIFWLRFYNVPEKIERLGAAELAHIRSDGDSESRQKISWAKLLTLPQTWSFVVGKFVTDPVWWFFLFWLPDYFKATRGLDIKDSWPHLVTIYSTVTVLSIAGGWLTGHLNRCGWTVTRARKTGMFIFALCVLPIIFATRVGDWGAVLLIGLAASAHQAWSANLYTTVSDMFPKAAVASVTGLGGMAGSLGGMMFPVLTGMLLDAFRTSHNITGGYAILFGICAGAYLVAFGLNHLLAPRFEPIKENLA
jgi:MFS transporter, ACS family, hexuronate transporter